MHRYGGKEGVIWIYVYRFSENTRNLRLEDVVMEPEIAS